VSEFIAERIWPGAVLERSIFGTDEPEEIWRQVLQLCPDAVSCFAFEVGIGASLGLQLRDGTRIALKVHLGRQALDYLRAVQRVQQHLWEKGFPCPRPLGVRDRATLEEWRDEGEYRDAHEAPVRRVLAEQLVRLFRLTEELQPLAGMEPYFPPNGGNLWPTPHNALFDFEATAAGAEWIDAIATEAKPVADSRTGKLVIGHGDWSVKHFRFDGLRPTVIYDWDSLNTDFETVFVANAAATFTYTEHLAVDVWPTVDEAQAFITDYVDARGEQFTSEERRAVAGAAVYSRAYAARCTHAVGKNAHEIGLHEYAAALL
jgi:hypothetical protein